jgi:hypothetical protein
MWKLNYDNKLTIAASPWYSIFCHIPKKYGVSLRTLTSSINKMLQTVPILSQVNSDHDFRIYLISSFILISPYICLCPLRRSFQTDFSTKTFRVFLMFSVTATFLIILWKFIQCWQRVSKLPLFFISTNFLIINPLKINVKTQRIVRCFKMFIKVSHQFKTRDKVKTLPRLF